MYVLRYFFDFPDVCLWAANDAARERFGYPIELSDLPVSDELRSALREACERFNTSLDWSNPAGPSLWSEQDVEQFKRLADQLLAQLRNALGSSFEIRDERSI